MSSKNILKDLGEIKIIEFDHTDVVRHPLVSKIILILDNISWTTYLKNPNNFINKKLKLINNKNKLYKRNTLTCSLLLTKTSKIKKLNKKFRNKNKSTDVLS